MSLQVHTHAIALAILLGTLGQGAIASAQGCECTCLGRFTLTSAGSPSLLGPFTLPSEVPANAQIFAWLADYDPSSVEVRRAGQVIPVVVEPTGVPSAYWVAPAEPFVPSPQYTISVDGSPRAPSYESTFYVPESLDLSAPEVTGEARATPLRDHDSCADIVGTAFELDFAGSPDVRVFEIEVLRAGEVVAHTFAPGPAFGTSPDPGCFGGFHVDGLVEGESLDARVRGWDAAGNASDFVTFPFTPRLARAGADRRCGTCSVTPARAGAPLLAWAVALPLLGAAGLRRRAGIFAARV